MAFLCDRCRELRLKLEPILRSNTIRVTFFGFSEIDTSQNASTEVPDRQPSDDGRVRHTRSALDVDRFEILVSPHRVDWGFVGMLYLLAHLVDAPGGN